MPGTAIYYGRLVGDWQLWYPYIDDIILNNIDQSHISNFPVNYPTYLELTESVLSNNAIHFLDLKFIIKDNKTIADISEKSKDFQFKTNTFSHFKSCLNISVYRNILLINMFRIKSLSSSYLSIRILINKFLMSYVMVVQENLYIL